MRRSITWLVAIAILAGVAILPWRGQPAVPAELNVPPALGPTEVPAEERAASRTAARANVPERHADTEAPASPSGARVAGRVTDRDGWPVSGVEVTLQRAPTRRDASAPVLSALVAIAARDGTLAFATRVAAGEWRLGVRGRCRLLRPQLLTVRAGQTEIDLSVVVEDEAAAETLAGFVLDEEDTPVADVPIWALHMPASGSWRGTSQSGRSDAEGRFVIRRSSPDTEPVTLMLDPTSDTGVVALDWSAQTYAWGRRDVRLRVRSSNVVVELLVVEAASGSPVEEYGVRCFHDERGHGRLAFGDDAPDVHSDGRRPGGRLRIDTLKSGGHTIVVVPARADLVPTAVRVEADRQRPIALRVELPRRLALPVVVVNAAQAPVSGVRVELLCWEGMTPLSLATPTRCDAGAWTPRAKLNAAVELDEATTDDGGAATLHGPGTSGTLAVKVTPSGAGELEARLCLPALVMPVSLQPDMPPLRIQLVTGAGLRGRVVPARVLDALGSTADGRARAQARFGVRLRSATGLELPYDRTSPYGFALDAHGGFAIAPLPPGDLDVALVWSRFLAPGYGVSDRRLLQTVRGLRAGEVRDVELDASALAPITFRGRVTVNGAPLVRARLELQCAALGSATGRPDLSSVPGLATDGNGRFSTPIVPCQVRIHAQIDGDRWAYGDEWIRVGPGADRDIDFALARRRFIVRVLEADGVRPAAGRTLFVQSDAWHGVPILTADADGIVVVDPAPAGPFHLVALKPGVTIEQRGRLSTDPARLAEIEVHLDPITVPPHRLEARIEQRLPGGR